MAVNSTSKISVFLKLENGQDEDGNMKYVSVSLGSLNKDKFDADKTLAVVQVLRNCFTKTVASVEKIEVGTIKAA